MTELLEQTNIKILNEETGKLSEPCFKTPSGELISMSELELVCVEPISVAEQQRQKNVHEEIALKLAREKRYEYVKVSEYCFSSVPFVQSIGGEVIRTNTYLAQFYRSRE